MPTTTRTRKAAKKPPTTEDKSQSNAVETEMVTLERIDNQKNHLLKNCYFKKVCTDEESGIQIKAQSLILQNTNFGLKSRFAALISLLEGQLAGKVKYFNLLGSTITSAKL